MTTIGAEKKGELKRTRVRSPAYPYIDLREAVERAEAFEKTFRRGTTSVEAAARNWGFQGAGSVPVQIIAALKYFGLMEDSGRGEERNVRLTDTALRILLDHDKGSEERRAAIQKAALNPTIHAELWEKWGPKLPEDSAIKNYLLFHKHFNRDVVERFVAEYKSTISFAELADSDSLPSMESSKQQSTEPAVKPSDISAGAWYSMQKQAEHARQEREFAYCPLGQDESGQDRGARVLLRGQPTQADIDDLIAYLTIVKRRLPKGDK